MNLTALGFLGPFFIGLFLAFAKHPFFGLLAYIWVFYNPPASRWWGADLPDIRWSFIAGIITLIAILIQSKNDQRPSWMKNTGAQLLILWTVLIWIQSLWAVDLSFHMDGAILYTKYLLLFFLIHHLVATEEYLDWFVLAIVVGGFIFGWIAYTEAGGGRFERIQAGGFNDANTAGMYFAILVAMGGFLFMKFRDWRKWIVLACLPFILNGLILTGSRGAFVALLCGGIVAFLLAPVGKRKTLFAYGALGGFLLLILGHDLFWDRMIAILPDEEGQLESSAASRFDVFDFGWEMAKDHPLGTGYFGHKLLSASYMPEDLLSARVGMRAAHNTFMNALVEQGFIGAFLFLSLWIWAGWTLWNLKFLDRRGLHENLGFHRAGLGAGFMILFVAGQFHNFLAAEVGIWLFAMLSSLQLISAESLRTAEENMLEASIEKNR